MDNLSTVNKPLNKSELVRLKSNPEQIIIYIYRFRYLNRPQLQTLLNHKSRSYILDWLNYLSDQKFLKQYYNPKTPDEASYYSLGTIGRKYLIKFQNELSDINIDLLDRVWREGKYTPAFKKHTMFLGDVFISLRELVKQVDGGQGKLWFFTQTDLVGVEHLVSPEPEAYFFIEDKDKNVQSYFLEMIDEHAKWENTQKTIRKYFKYFKKNTWQENMKTEFPEIIIICPDYQARNGLNKFILKQFKTQQLELSIHLTTKIEIKSQGITWKVLHKVKFD